MRQKIKIIFLCYHYIKRKDELNRIWGHDFDLFKKHIAFLEKEYKPVSMEDLGLFLEGKDVDMPDRCSILTFDDGIKEQATVIAPYLAEKNISAVFNICPCILDGEPATPQVTHCGTAYYGVKKFYKLLQKYIGISGVDKYYIDLLRRKYASGINALALNSGIKTFFKMELPFESGRKVLLEIWHKELERDIPDIMQKIFMSEADIKNISKMNHSIGLHTNTHATLDRDKSTDIFFEEELNKPKIRLESLTGNKVRCFAYPFCYEDYFLYDAKILSKMRDIGIEYIFTIFKKSNKLSRDFIGRYSSQSGDSVEILKNKIWEYEITRYY